MAREIAIESTGKTGGEVAEMQYRIISARAAEAVSDPLVSEVGTKLDLIEKAAKSLELKVNEHIKQGWSPTGGVCVASCKGCVTVLQAIVKM